MLAGSIEINGISDVLCSGTAQNVQKKCIDVNGHLVWPFTLGCLVYKKGVFVLVSRDFRGPKTMIGSQEILCITQVFIGFWIPVYG